MSIVDYISSLATPDCCMTFDYLNNPVKFEVMIPGYRTNSVTGRDSLTTEATESTNKFKDGTDLERSRHQTRDITVTSTLVSETVEDHRKNLDLLKGYLHKFDGAGSVSFMFDDEADVYYEGIVTSITETQLEVDGYASTVVITLHCPKPYKYSVIQYECVNHAVDVGGTTKQIITVNYNGTAKVYPQIVIQPKVEYGFIGLANQHGRVLQLGDPDELDKDYYSTKTKTLTNPMYNETGAVVAPSGWSINSGTVYTADPNYPSAQTGSFKIATVQGLKGIVINSAGSGTGWHGPSVMYTVPNADRDVCGIYGWYHYFAMQTDVAVGNLGCQQFLMLDSNKQIIAAVDYRKNKPNNKDAFVQMFVKNKRVEKIQYEPIRYNTISGHVSGKGYGNSHIYKFGKLVIFDINGKKYQFTEPTLQDVTICYVVAYSAASINYSQMDSVIGALKYSRNQGGINNNNIPNKIQPNHDYNLDCERGEIFVDSSERPDLGALGNDWEEFYLEPGINQFECLCSDWYEIGSQSNYATRTIDVWDPTTGDITRTDDAETVDSLKFPRYAMTYREVFI